MRVVSWWGGLESASAQSGYRCPVTQGRQGVGCADATVEEDLVFFRRILSLKEVQSLQEGHFGQRAHGSVTAGVSHKADCLPC